MRGGAALRCVAEVVPEQAAEAFTALDFADLLSDLAARVDDLVVQPLMVAFPMIVMEEVRHSPAQRFLPEENHTSEAFLLYYNESRCHRSLDDNAPVPRDVEPLAMGNVIAFPVLGGLHHRYSRAA